MLRTVRASTRVASKAAFMFTRCSPLSTRYTASHEFVKIEGDIGTVGITQFAADALGDIVFVDLPSIGTKYAAGESFGSVESVKAASDVYSPVAGEVVAVNADLEETPGTVNESPVERGWFMKVRVGAEGMKTFEGLLDEAAYKKHMEDSAH